MSTSDFPTAETARAAAAPHRMLLVTLTAAIFVSAALLFAVQPMFTKMVLPRLGGAPSVWSVAMVFFQAALLAGYAYAHLLTRYAPGRASVVIHVVVMLLWRTPVAATVAAENGDAESAPPTWSEVASWVGLAAVPAGLLVAVTAHISTDVAAVPLLWVLPLALYLATFVIVFARRPVIPHWLVVDVQPLFVLGLVAILIFEPVKQIVGLIAIHLA